MRILLEKGADWISPDGRQHVSLPAGESTVRREVGEALVAAGKAVELDPPTKAEAKKKGK